MGDIFMYVDKATGEPCPTSSNRLCTIMDPEHRHVSSAFYREPISEEPIPTKPTAEAVLEALHQRHGPKPGVAIWQRNYETGLLESTCECGEVLAVEERYEFSGVFYTPEVIGAGAAWANHRDQRVMEAILALFPGRTEAVVAQEAEVRMLDEAADDLQAMVSAQDPSAPFKIGVSTYLRALANQKRAAS